MQPGQQISLPVQNVLPQATPPPCPPTPVPAVPPPVVVVPPVPVVDAPLAPPVPPSVSAPACPPAALLPVDSSPPQATASMANIEAKPCQRINRCVRIM